MQELDTKAMNLFMQYDNQINDYIQKYAYKDQAYTYNSFKNTNEFFYHRVNKFLEMLENNKENKEFKKGMMVELFFLQNERFITQKQNKESKHLNNALSKYI